MRRLTAPVITGALGALAFPPFDLGLLALVAPVPLLVHWRGLPPKRAAADGFVAGTVFFGVVVVWTWYFGVVAYFPFVAVLAASWALTGALISLAARRGVSGPLVTAAVWTLVEALRGRWPFGGFSWGELGYAFHDVPVARSVAAWGGVLFVSFLAILVAASLAEAYAARVGARVGERRGGLRSLAGVVGVAAVVAGADLGLPDVKTLGSLRVAIVQGNDLNRRLTYEELADRYLPRSHFDLADRLEGPLDLVILPESSLDEDPRIDRFLESELARIARRLDAPVLANASVEIDNGERLENTNFLYDERGRLVGTYVKQHLVPYGEYVPGRRFLEKIVPQLDQIPRDHVPGDARRTFRVNGLGLANLICFESAFTEIARAYAGDGANVLIVSTNNRSFRRSANTDQHLAIGQMRAAETGRPLVQASISGKSAFVDHRGDVVATTDLFERTTLVGTVQATTGRTPYVVLGDWILVASALLLVASGAFVVMRGRFARSGRHS